MAQAETSATTTAGGHFGAVELAKPNAIFHLNTMFKADETPGKMNLGIGAFRDDSGQPWVLPAVKKAEAELAAEVEANKINHEYLAIGGIAEFSAAAAE
eukprot:UC1_evm1s1100